MQHKDKTCPLRSECLRDADRQIFRDLFKHDWEVFVIKLDTATGKHNWFTECCERIADSVTKAGERVMAA